MVDVMVTNICREPAHDRTHPHETRGLHRRLLVGPACIVAEGHSREIVLRVKKVAADGAGEKVGNHHGEQQPWPADQEEERRGDDEMNHEGDEAIEMFTRIGDAGVQAHSVKKDKEVAEQNRQRMPHEQILEACDFGRPHEMRAGHDRKRPNMRAAQLRIVGVMMVVRAAPDARRAQDENPKNPHEALGQPGMRQDCPMLLIVINDKQAQIQQPGEQAARDLACKG